MSGGGLTIAEGGAEHAQSERLKAVSGWPASLMRGWLSDLCSQSGGGWCTAMSLGQAAACLANQRSNHPCRMGKGVADFSACLHWRIESVRARWNVWVPICEHQARLFRCKSVGFMRVLGVCDLWWVRLLVGWIASWLAFFVGLCCSQTQFDTLRQVTQTYAILVAISLFWRALACGTTILAAR